MSCHHLGDQEKQLPSTHMACVRPKRLRVQIPLFCMWLLATSCYNYLIFLNTNVNIGLASARPACLTGCYSPVITVVVYSGIRVIWRDGQVIMILLWPRVACGKQHAVMSLIIPELISLQFLHPLVFRHRSPPGATLGNLLMFAWPQVSLAQMCAGAFLQKLMVKKDLAMQTLAVKLGNTSSLWIEAVILY